MIVDFVEFGWVYLVYVIYWLVKYFEEVGCKIIFFFLDEGEGGIGLQVEVCYIVLVLFGMVVWVMVLFDWVEGWCVYVKLWVVNEFGDEIGYGLIIQVVLFQVIIDVGFNELGCCWVEFQEGC